MRENESLNCCHPMCHSGQVPYSSRDGHPLPLQFPFTTLTDQPPWLMVLVLSSIDNFNIRNRAIVEMP